MLRHLNDGQTFEIVKVFYEPGELGRRLDGLGWQADMRGSETFFVYGSAGLKGKNG